VDASWEGWRYADEHRDEALDMVMARVEEAHIPTNRTHQKWMLETILKTILPPQGTEWQPGSLLAGDYRNASGILRQQGLIFKPPATFAEFRPLDAGQ
jgi:NitT/TauT family transport system substrate-binding protein